MATVLPGTRDSQSWHFCGYDVVNFPTDGDCLFAAIAHQLNTYCYEEDEPLTVLDVRRQLVEYIRSDVDMTALIQASLDEDDTVKRYLDNMSLSGNWGDGNILAAACKYYKRNVVVLKECPKPITIDCHDTSDYYQTDQITLGFVLQPPSDNENHYISLVEKASDKMVKQSQKHVEQMRQLEKELDAANQRSAYIVQQHGIEIKQFEKKVTDVKAAATREVMQMQLCVTESKREVMNLTSKHAKQVQQFESELTAAKQSMTKTVSEHELEVMWLTETLAELKTKSMQQTVQYEVKLKQLKQDVADGKVAIKTQARDHEAKVKQLEKQINFNQVESADKSREYEAIIQRIGCKLASNEAAMIKLTEEQEAKVNQLQKVHNNTKVEMLDQARIGQVMITNLEKHCQEYEAKIGRLESDVRESKLQLAAQAPLTHRPPADVTCLVIERQLDTHDDQTTVHSEIDDGYENDACRMTLSYADVVRSAVRKPVKHEAEPCGNRCDNGNEKTFEVRRTVNDNIATRVDTHFPTLGDTVKTWKAEPLLMTMRTCEDYDDQPKDNIILERLEEALTASRRKNMERLMSDVFRHTAKLIHTWNEISKPVFGLTVLNNELYVRYEDTEDISVYDSTTYTLQRTLPLPGLRHVSDMTSCMRYQCIYLADGTSNMVYRVAITNINVTQWHLTNVPEGLSVSSAYNVLVTYCWVGKIAEFSTDGNLLREISLQSDIVHPTHAVELTADQFVVCHGIGNDKLHRVCLVNDDGLLIRSYGGRPGSGVWQVKEPIRLAANGFICVADSKIRRVLILNPTLNEVHEVASGLRGPARLVFDGLTGRLYVADNRFKNGKWKSGQLKVFEFDELRQRHEL